MTCFIKIEFITEEVFTKEHKHYKLVKMESIYKSIVRPSREAWLWLDRESLNTEKCTRFDLREIEKMIVIKIKRLALIERERVENAGFEVISITQSKFVIVYNQSTT